ncbi:MAG: hypothetical protein JNM58_01775 [Xanthomonadaceae bacterium]|nr:hypothetical protein [Xanthomonadaceae bacterium]
MSDCSADPATGRCARMMYGVDTDHVARGDNVNVANPCPPTCADIAPSSSHLVRDRSGRDTLLLRAIDSQGRLSGDTMNLALPCPSTCDTTGS